MNKDRIYRYENLIDSIYESIICSMDNWLSKADKCQKQDFFAQQERYKTLVKGAWLGFGPFMLSECTQEEAEAIYNCWKDVTEGEYFSPEFR